MKRIASIALVGAVVAFAGQAWAGVSGSAHDVASALGAAAAGFGVCSSCHIPHKAVGDRLWPKPITGTSALRGDVGNLCTYCHDPTNGVLGASQTPYPFKDQKTSTHGMVKTNLPDVANSFDTTLPYMGVASANMQCTSCHNVHDQSGVGQLAFLQAPIDVLCARCHSNRQFVNGVAQSGSTAATGAWGVATRSGFDSTGAAGNPGSHPVGTDILGDVSTHNWNGVAASADSPVTTTIMAIEAWGTGTNYPLGPKLIGGAVAADAATFTGGVGCVTCHMVHGRNGATNADPNPDLLVFYQTENGVTGQANGVDVDTNNALCEACHRGAAPATATGTYAGTFFPNPGAGTGTHPVDDYYLLVDAGVTGVPAGWPTGITTRADGGSPHLICESCHTPHPLQSVTRGQTNVVAPGTNNHILRNADRLICDNCHTGTGVANHHPIGAGIMGTRFVDSSIGNNDADLTCTDCHNGSGAHNWLGAGQVGLDPDWIPFNNGRGTETEAARYVANTSVECVKCHTNSGAHYSPDRAVAGGFHSNANYQARGEGSHYIGSFDAVNWTWGGTALNPDGSQAAGANFVNDPWDQATAGGAYTGYSRFGGIAAASAVVTCESCHELEPDKNNGYGHLLLAPYTDGTAAQSRSILCEGCHSPQGTSGGNAHPQTGSTISRAQSAARPSGVLLQTATTGYADAGARGDTTYPAADQMNCDSCHQPHGTVAVAGTYILEDSAAVTSAMTGTPALAVPATQVGYAFAGVRYAPAQATNALNFQPFCALCHNSGN
jgi:predicted CXXCH cytochrome family protein